MLEAIDNVNEFTQGATLEELNNNKMLRHAVAHNIQIVGEAAYKLTKEFCAAHPEVPWKDIIGLRHVLVHDYYNVKVQEIWNIAKDDLPTLREHVVALIDEIQNSK